MGDEKKNPCEDGDIYIRFPLFDLIDLFQTNEKIQGWKTVSLGME